MKEIITNREDQQPTYGPAGASDAVVLATTNRAQVVHRLRHTLSAQRAQLAELGTTEIVILDQSRCSSWAQLPHSPRSSNNDEPRLVSLHAPWIDGAAAARKGDLSMGWAPYVVPLDHAVPEPDCLESLGETLDRHSVLLAARRLVANHSSPPLPFRLFRGILCLVSLDDGRQPIYRRARGYALSTLSRSRDLHAHCMAFSHEGLALGGFKWTLESLTAYRLPKPAKSTTLARKS